MTAGLDAVGVRIPAHPIARALIERSGVPIAAPSANVYTRTSPTTAAHVAAQLGDAVDLILDGGPSTVGIESTVLDVTGPVPVLMRLGGVSRAALEAVFGPVATPQPLADGGSTAPLAGNGRAALCPQRATPRLRRQPTERASGDVSPPWWREGERVGIIAFDIDGARATSATRMPRDAAGYARALYAALHLLDLHRLPRRLRQEPSAGGRWDAIADRLRRAGLRQPRWRVSSRDEIRWRRIRISDSCKATTPVTPRCMPVMRNALAQFAKYALGGQYQECAIARTCGPSRFLRAAIPDIRFESLMLLSPVDPSRTPPTQEVRPPDAEGTPGRRGDQDAPRQGARAG